MATTILAADDQPVVRSGNLIEAITIISKGKSDLCPSVIADEKREVFDSLSAAEKKIVGLLACNMTSKSIAKEFQISVRTVQNHRSRICKKLNLRGMNSLLVYVLENAGKL